MLARFGSYATRLEGGQSGSRHGAQGLDVPYQKPFPCQERPVGHRTNHEDLCPCVDHDRAVEFAGSAVRHEGGFLWCLVAGGMHTKSWKRSDNLPLNTLPFTQEDVLQGLRHLPTMKALAPPCIPAIIWRHLATELAGPIHAALECHWCAEQVAPPSHWLAGWLHLIPKPGKPSTQPAALRPICLQHPVLKGTEGMGPEIGCQRIVQFIGVLMQG